MAGLPPVDDRTMRTTYERVLARRPDGLAQTDADGSVTFADSYARSLRLAAGFAAAGVARQEPAALMLDNSLDQVHAFTGLALGGMIEVPVNTAYKGQFLAHILNDSGATVAVAEDGYLDRLAAISGELTSLRTIVVRGDPAHAGALASRFRIMPFADLEVSGSAAPDRVEAGDLIAYMYTSGTTGPSKGVLISHAHAYTYASRENQDRPRAGDRILVTLPLFHLAWQWYGVYQALIHQIPCWIEPGFSASGFWRTVRRHGITVTVALGAMAELLQQQPPRPRDGQAIDPVKLTAFLIERLPYFMVPRYLEFTDALPKTPTQKVHKHVLRDRGVGPHVWDREAAGIVLRRSTVR